MPPKYDCQRCGLCCIADLRNQPYYVYLDERDIQRLPSFYKRHAIPARQFDGWGLATKKRDDGEHVCVAFEGKEGVSCRCAIYETRPDVCRSFEPGGVSCRDVREQSLLLGVSNSKSPKKTAKPSASSAGTSGRTRT